MKLAAVLQYTNGDLTGWMIAESAIELAEKVRLRTGNAALASAIAVWHGGMKAEHHEGSTRYVFIADEPLPDSIERAGAAIRAFGVHS